MKQIAIILFFLFGVSSNDTPNGFPYSTKLLDLEGNEINSQQFQTENEFLIIDFWNISCGPCIMKFDAIAANFEEWNAKTNFKIIAVAAQTRDSRTMAFIEEKNWPFEVYFDPDYDLFRTLLKNYDQSGSIQFSFPTSFIFNEEMNLVEKKTGIKTKLKEGMDYPKNENIPFSDYFEIDLNFYYELNKKLNDA